MATIKLYLTSLEPDMEQTIYSQSIGGYYSNSLLYPETTLSSTIGLYDMSIVLNIPSEGNWLQWSNVEYINIGNEIIKVSPISNGLVSVVQRGYNGIINMHIASDIVRAASSKNLFNNVFNDDHKQYRCIAAKNVSSLSDPSDERIAYDISVYLKQDSRNTDSVIKVAIENPTSQYLVGFSTSWNTMQIIDTYLIGEYEDNQFKNAYLKIGTGEAAGQGKIVNSFDSSTGTFTFYSSFSSSYDYTTNVSYEVHPSPAQRIKTGTISSVSSFYSPTENIPLSFRAGGSVPVISDLHIGDIIYVWLERTLQKGSEAFDANDIVLNIKYKVR